LISRSTGSQTTILREIRDHYGIHLFPVSTPLPSLKTNIYYVAKPRPTLIDVPPNAPVFVDELEYRLREVGSSIKLIETILVTHPHFDHYGSANTIVKISGAQVWVMQGSGAWLEDFEKELHEEEKFTVDFLTKAGTPARLVRSSVEALRFIAKFAGGVKPSRYLHASEKIELSSGHFEVRHVPGHTPWCMMLHNVESGIAFTGDFLLQKISSNPMVQRRGVGPVGYKSLKAYASSLKKVRDMHLRVALPGHGEIIGKPSRRIEEVLRFMQERQELVRKQIETGGLQTPFQIAQKLFPMLPKEQTFLAVSEVVAHLEALEEGYRL
jgi:glyoxylase-like metal-dependent hydrolase (beta-lactamase superfamily II)